MKKKIKRLKKRLNILTKALGFKWVDCPDSYKDYPLTCQKGFLDYDKNMPCSTCHTVGKVLKKVI